MAFTKGRGAPKGNTNSARGKPWRDAIVKFAAQNPEALRAAANALFISAAGGDVSAAKEIGDRLDGKSVQALDIDMDAKLTLDNVLNVKLV